MKQNIRLKITSTRFETEASLFSEAESDLLLSEDEEAWEAEPETLEIRSLGTLRRESGQIEYSYEETEATGMAGSTTAVSFREDHPELVTMLREGAVSTALVFEEGKRHHCVYQTPFMPFEICVHTLKVENRLAADGVLKLDYIIEIRGARAERTKFCMEIY